MLRKHLLRAAILLVAVVPLAAQPLPAAAASAGTLFALGPSSIGKVDPVSGVFTTFANLAGGPGTGPAPALNNLASDPAHHRLFVVQQTFAPDFSSVTFQLITVDTQSGAVTVSPDMAQGVTDLAYDTGTGALFGQTNMCCPFQLVQIDPSTGAQTHVADIPGVQPLRMTAAPGKHTIYLPTEDFVAGQFQPVVTVVAIDEVSGTVTQSAPVATGLFGLVYDTSSQTLFGKTFCCPASLVAVNATTGVETAVTSGLPIGSGLTIDSATHTVFMTDDELTAFGFSQFIIAVNDQTGAQVKSSGTLPSDTYVGSLAFEGVAITPDSIRSDVRAAFSSGSITRSGIETALLGQLNAAAAARSRGQCGVAAADYRAFVNTVRAQSGKSIAAATASRLISEAEYLQANCP